MSLERARQAALVQAALRGDERAREELGALAEEYLRRCFFRHARRCYGDGVKEELEDIASDAVEKCMERLDRFQGGRALFTTWVYGFAKNVLRNHHRKRARRDRIWEEVRKDQSAWWHEPPPDEPHFGGDPLRWVIHQEKLEEMCIRDRGSDVWFGGNVVVLPGVTIGSGSVIGAGSVVTRDVPPGVLAAGNPCRVIRRLVPEEG